MKCSSSPTPGPQAITQPTGSVFKKQDSLAWLTATQYLDLLQKREITVLDYAQACADFIDILEPKLSAWAWFDRDRFVGVSLEKTCRRQQTNFDVGNMVGRNFDDSEVAKLIVHSPGHFALTFNF